MSVNEWIIVMFSFQKGTKSFEYTRFLSSTNENCLYSLYSGRSFSWKYTLSKYFMYLHYSKIYKPMYAYLYSYDHGFYISIAFTITVFENL